MNVKKLKVKIKYYLHVHFFSIRIIESAFTKFATKRDNFAFFIFDFFNIVMTNRLDVLLLRKPWNGDLLFCVRVRVGLRHHRLLHLHLWHLGLDLIGADKGDFRNGRLSR